MPVGVDVEVTDGVASIEFVDKSKRGPGLGALLAVGGPGSVEKVTRPQVRYLVAESVAAAAGLLDVAEPKPTYDDGLPDDDWSRAALNEHAAKVGIEAPEKLPNKDAVIEAITAKKAEQT